MKAKDSILGIFWKLIYPILIFVGVEILIEFIVSGIVSGYGVSKGLVSADNPKELSEWVTDTVSGYLIYISMLRSIIVIPLCYFIIRKDIIFEIGNKTFVAYSSYDKRWLLLLPVLAVAMAYGFNHIVPLFAEGVQNLLNTIGRAWFAKDWNIDFLASYSDKAKNVYSNKFVIKLISAGILTPVTEELLFRGLLYSRLRKNINATGSMIISAVVFAAFHGNFVQIIYAFMVGIIFAHIYEQFKSVWASVILHCVANITAVITTYTVGANGIAVGMGSIVLLSTVELAICFIILFILKKKVNRIPLNE